VEKRRVTCPRCGGDLPEAAATGRPRVYCSALCRRDAEFWLRRLQGHLARAERQLTTARLAKVTEGPYTYRNGDAADRVKFWTAEVKKLSADLRAGLAAQPDDGDED